MSDKTPAKVFLDFHVFTFDNKTTVAFNSKARKTLFPLAQDEKDILDPLCIEFNLSEIADNLYTSSASVDDLLIDLHRYKFLSQNKSLFDIDNLEDDEEVIKNADSCENEDKPGYEEEDHNCTCKVPVEPIIEEKEPEDFESQDVKSVKETVKKVEETIAYNRNVLKDCTDKNLEQKTEIMEKTNEFVKTLLPLVNSNKVKINYYSKGGRYMVDVKSSF